MPADISNTDLLAFGLFMAAWCGYTLIMDHLAHGLLGLNQHLTVLRIEWVRRMLDRDNRIMDTAPFVFHGQYMDGCLTRLSTESLVNVTAGGGSSLANFIVAER